MERLDNMELIATLIKGCEKYAQLNDTELAHMYEKNAWRVALDAIAAGDPRAVEIATLAKTTTKIDFGRFYA